MLDDTYSTHHHQPKPAREIAIHVHELEHQISVNGALARSHASASLAQSLRSFTHKLRLLVASF